MPIIPLVMLGVGALAGGGTVWFASDKVGTMLKWGAILGGGWLAWKHRTKLKGILK